jgi:hypothetical protein
MDTNAQQTLDLFADNAQIIKKEFTWQYPMMKRLAALLYAAEGKEIKPYAIRECFDMIKRSTGLFSSFRGNSIMTVAALLSLCDDSSALFDKTLAVFQRMKHAGFHASDFLVVGAYQIAANAPEDQFDDKVGRAKAFYDGMKNDHWFLTGQDDYIFSVMLGLSDIEVTTGLRRMEMLYQTLRPEFHSGTGVQGLTHVLVLGEDTSGIQRRILALRDALRSRSLRLDRSYTLSSLGVLALLPIDAQSIAAQIEETMDLLRTKKGFGSWSVAKQEIMLLSAGLVTLSSVDQIKQGVLETMLATSITNIVIAQQTAIAAAAASSASASAASST